LFLVVLVPGPFGWVLPLHLRPGCLRLSRCHVSLLAAVWRAASCLELFWRAQFLLGPKPVLFRRAALPPAPLPIGVRQPRDLVAVRLRRLVPISANSSVWRRCSNCGVFLKNIHCFRTLCVCHRLPRTLFLCRLGHIKSLW